MPAFEAEKEAAQGFALRDRSRPPPRTGKTVTDAFPPTAPGPAQAQAGSAPLTVTRRAPVGKVALAPSLSVSFSTAMVALAAHDEQPAPPVKLTPTPPGKWRWAGSQTAIFDPEKRFPMATEYTVEVPAGTRAANGQAIAAAERWTFVTPPPAVVDSYPKGGPTGLDPLMYFELDQAIDAAAVLRHVQVTGGSGTVEVRAATEEEIRADAELRLVSERALGGRWGPFKAKAPLAPGTAYLVRLPAGLASAEGPRRTEKEQNFLFATYAPLRIERLDCWGGCPPGQPWSLMFNNPIDVKRFDRAWIKVSPEPASLRIDVTDRYVEIRPRSRGKTKYTVTASAALRDVFGQTLGKDATAQVTVDVAEPRLFEEERDMSVLDPGAAPVLPVFSVNRPSLNVRLYAVGPGDWPGYLAWRRAWDEDRKDTTPPGRLVAARAVSPPGEPDTLTVTPIDLTAALHEGVGQVLVVVEAAPSGAPVKRRAARQRVRAWVQVTRLGVAAFTDGDAMVAWATRLADGAPVEGVEVGVAGSAATAASGADGLARIALPEKGDLVVARKGADVALLPEHWQSEGAFQQRRLRDDVRWLVFDDRGIYKPGEALHAKAWVRVVGAGKGGDVRALPAAAGREVRWRIVDARDVELGKGASVVDASGGLDLEMRLPKTPNLGRARIDLVLDDVEVARHFFEIQEFRRPEFEVSARAGGGPYFVGDHADVTVAATYYAGGGLPNAEVSWQVTRSDARFVPPNRGDFAFGKTFTSWWTDPRVANRVDRLPWTGRTGASGEHRVRLDFDAVDPPYPMSLDVEATVVDVNRQAWTAHAGVLVHPASVYVGVKQERAFVKAGEPLGVDVIVTDVDGAAVAGRAVTVKSARIDWEYRAGEYAEIESDVDGCAVTSAAEAVRCALIRGDGGQYSVT